MRMTLDNKQSQILDARKEKYAGHLTTKPAKNNLPKPKITENCNNKKEFKPKSNPHRSE
jgi:hypothetical protein